MIRILIWAVIIILITVVLVMIALPMCMVPRITDNEGAAASHMKSGIFALEYQLQASGLIDYDGDGIGEFGFIPDLQAMRQFGGPDAEIDDNGRITMNGYHFQIYLPDGNGGMYTYKDFMAADDKKQGVDLREKYYLVLGWPVALNETGRRIYVMMQDGNLRSPSLIAEKDAIMKDPNWRHFFDAKNDNLSEENLRNGIDLFIPDNNNRPVP